MSICVGVVIACASSTTRRAASCRPSSMLTEIARAISGSWSYDAWRTVSRVSSFDLT